jgi:hypothetical protein
MRAIVDDPARWADNFISQPVPSLMIKYGIQGVDFASGALATR